MKENRAKIAAVVVVLLLVGAAAVSETVNRGRMRAGGSMFGDHMLMYMTHKLDLTADQQAQVKQIMAKERPAMRPLMKQMGQNRIQLAQLMLNGNVQEAQINAIATQQAQATAQLFTQEAHIESQLIQILTQEQKTKLGEMLTQHQQRFMNGGQEQQQPSNESTN